jgi:hypothetical protein
MKQKWLMLATFLGLAMLAMLGVLIAAHHIGSVEVAQLTGNARDFNLFVLDWEIQEFLIERGYGWTVHIGKTMFFPFLFLLVAQWLCIYKIYTTK